jgi:hypothetical protein
MQPGQRAEIAAESLRSEIVNHGSPIDHDPV